MSFTVNILSSTKKKIVGSYKKEKEQNVSERERERDKLFTQGRIVFSYYNIDISSSKYTVKTKRRIINPYPICKFSLTL
jgi:hypothetical protein